MLFLQRLLCLPLLCKCITILTSRRRSAHNAEDLIQVATIAMHQQNTDVGLYVPQAQRGVLRTQSASRQGSNEELEHQRKDTEPSERICTRPKQLLSLRSAAWHSGLVQIALRMSLPKRTGSTRQLLSADSRQSALEKHRMVVVSEGCAPCLQ